MTRRRNRNEIQIGDVGTKFQVPTYDDNLTPANFDPTSAAVKKLFIATPQVGGGMLTHERTAVAEQFQDKDGATVWGLTYTVLASDTTMFVAPGSVSLQGYVEFSSAQKWKSNVVTSDQNGRELRIAANL